MEPVQVTVEEQQVLDAMRASPKQYATFSLSSSFYPPSAYPNGSYTPE
jgi:hypothetical protein